MQGYHFVIREPTERAIDGIVEMDGVRLQGVTGYKIESSVHDGLTVVTISFLAKSLNRETAP